MTAKMRILVLAARIRMRKGLGLEEILGAWPDLSEAEREAVRSAVNPG